MTDWQINLVSTPGTLWARYADAIGLDDMQGIYGKHWPPATARPGETVYSFRDPDKPAPVFNPKDHPDGWLSLTVDQFDPGIVHMSRGVWPDCHGRGLGKRMRSFAEGWAVAQGAMVLQVAIHHANQEHLRNVVEDPYWELGGAVVAPIRYTIFFHRLHSDTKEE